MRGHAENADARKAKGARMGLYIHLAAYLGVNALLIGINLATSTERLWFKWPLMGWGVGLLAHALAVLALPALLRGRAGGV